MPPAGPVAIAAALLGAMLLARSSPSSSSPAPAPRRPATGGSGRTPTAYGREYLRWLRRLYAGPEGAALRRYLPRITAQELPASSVPVTAWLGFAANSAPGGRLDDTPGAAFHAWGLYGIESTNWPGLVQLPEVRTALGRAPSADWRDLDTQTVVGVTNILRQYHAAVGTLATAPPWGSWPAWVLACAAWSAGPQMARRLANAYATAASSEGDRWAAWVRAVLPWTDGAAGTHRRPAFTLLRSAQKWAAGRALAVSVRALPEWYGPAIPAEVESALVAGAYAP